jgi:hypothetical protein
VETIQGNPWLIGGLVLLILVLFCVERLIVCERRRHVRHAHPDYWGERYEVNDPIDD